MSIVFQPLEIIAWTIVRMVTCPDPSHFTHLDSVNPADDRAWKDKLFLYLLLVCFCHSYWPLLLRMDYYAKGLCKHSQKLNKTLATFKVILLAFFYIDKKSRTTSWCLSPSPLVFWCQSSFSCSPFGNNGEKKAALHTQQKSLSKFEFITKVVLIT